MCKREHCHCLCIQKTHRGPHPARPKRTGMTLVATGCTTDTNCLLAMLNNYFTQNKIPTIWRKSRTIAILIPGKHYRSIFLLCHTCKLYERLILNRIAPTIEEHLIKEPAVFQPQKSCKSHRLNLTQHIEDVYQKGKITGTEFVDLSAAYDTVNHRLLIQKHYTRQNLLPNRWFYVEVNNEHSRWRKQNNGLQQGKVLALTLFNVYTNDQRF